MIATHTMALAQCVISGSPRGPGISVLGKLTELIQYGG